jgi:hypothetical protein
VSDFAVSMCGLAALVWCLLGCWGTNHDWCRTFGHVKAGDFVANCFLGCLIGPLIGLKNIIRWGFRRAFGDDFWNKEVFRCEKDVDRS